MRRMNWVVAALLLAGPAGAQVGGEQPTVPAPPPPGAPQPVEEELGEEQAPTMISMEAYREVLASGRYLVGPGDGFVIHLTGMDAPYYSEVLAEGGLYVPQVGMVPVAARSLEQARAAVAQAFGRAFKQGEINIQLSTLRQFSVPIVGAVARPGRYVASGVVRIGELVNQARVVGTTGSRRNIRVVKSGALAPGTRERVAKMVRTGDMRGVEELSGRVDLELYGVTGDSAHNPFVEDGDAIIVPPRAGKVYVQGAVQRPAIFELVAGDRISDLLTLALGPRPDHDAGRARLFRYADDLVTMEDHPVDLRGALAQDPAADLRLQDGDWLVLRAIAEYQKPSTVTVDGEVAYPGAYVVEKNSTTLRDILEQAGGFTSEASLPESRVMRLVSETEVEDPEVERIRTISVPDRTEDDNQYFIMKSREVPGQMVVDFRALFLRGDESQNIALMPGDVISVAQLKRTVKVSGQAAFPGAVVHEEDLEVPDYIERAGGLGWRASEDVRVIKARSGELRRADEEGELEPGDRIWIKEKPRRDYWELFTEGMEVVGTVATVLLIFVSLSR